jgi:drug/metabolite transporter (DMT)-like permease
VLFRSLLLSVVLTGFFAWLFIGEKITGEMIFGGFLVLVGIAITFKEKQLIAQKS